MSSGGVVAAGHPETAEAGARALREGGNAVDAAVAAVGASLVTESPLTGLGAGGHMLIHRPGEEPVLLDFFVAAPGLGAVERSSELLPIEIDFGDATQVFNVGAASCGVPGVPSGLAEAARRFGSLPLRVLLERGAELARVGVVLNREQAYLLALLEPILALEAQGAAHYRRDGKVLVEGETVRFPELAGSIELLGERGAAPFYSGEIAAAMSDRVLAGGGELTREDLAAYGTIARVPVRATYRGREFLSNPPPSSGGVLIALALELLDPRDPDDVVATVEVMEAAQEARSPAFLAGLHEEGFDRRFLADRLGSTTHITAVDGAGGCASVTCSNGSGSGIFVEGTGIHVNNMLGEQDLNPFGFHAIDAGAEASLDDVAIDRAPRGAARARPRERRLQPDPIGRHPGDPAHARRRSRRR